MADDTPDPEDDLDFAFNLQLHEALHASLTLQSPSDDLSPRRRLLSGDDRVAHREREGLARRVTFDLDTDSDEEFSDFGKNFPVIRFGEGSSSGFGSASDVFRLYFKGILSEEEGSLKNTMAGIGIAICDPWDDLILEESKLWFGFGLARQEAEAKALVLGLEAALGIGLDRIVVAFDSMTLFRIISGEWSSKQRKVIELVNKAKSLQRCFEHCRFRMLRRNEFKFAAKLARDVINSHMNGSAESSHTKNQTETCVICYEDNDVSQFFSVNGCLHRYCFSCMQQHVEFKLLNAQMPKCPHPECKSGLDIASCEKFLTPKFMELLRQRDKEATTPVAERVYCPYPRCSVLMSKTEVLEYSRKNGVDVNRLGSRRCVKCNELFCVNCKVPWHRRMTCDKYKRLNPNPPAEETKLMFLAAMNLWRQCNKCNLVVELAEGCYHMTCRCGSEFCYNCGSEWKDKKATCSCPLWDEDHILIVDSDEEEEEDDEEDDYDDFEDSDTEIHYNSDFDVHYVL